MNLSAWIGLRYYRARAAGGFVSLVSIVSFLGLALGMIAMLVVVSVMNGFDRELKERILGAVPHVVVQGPKVPAPDIEGYGVVAQAAYREESVLLVSRSGSHLLRIHGIDPVEDGAGDYVLNAMQRGQFSSLAGDQVEILLGDAVVRRFGLRLGQKVSLVVPKVSASGEALRPQLIAARLTGTFATGSEMDYRLGIMSIEDLASVLPGSIETRLRLSNIFLAPALRQKLEDSGYQVRDWTDEFGDFFSTVKMEKVMMFVLLSFVVAVASFGIVSGLTMLVTGKRRDIAVLRTMGMDQAGVLRIFLVQGLVIALAGVLAGLIIGLPLAYHIPEVMGYVESVTGFSIVAGTYFDQIPVDVRMTDVIAVLLVAMLISFLATLYPSWRAAQLNPAEVLRYE